MPITQLSLNVTDRCNLSCRYCLSQTANDKDMSLDTARKAVDLMIHHANDTPSLHLGFFGGEPLLCQETVRETTEYAAKKARDAGKGISFSITTNGTLLSPENIAFLQEKKFSVLVSVDGTPEMAEKIPSSRGLKLPSHDMDQRLERLADELGDRMGVRATIVPDTAPFLFKILRHYAEKNVISIGLVPALNFTWAEEALRVFEEQLRYAVDYWLQTLSTLNLNFQPAGYYAARFRGKLDYPSIFMHYCSDQHLGVAVDGGIYPCHRFALFGDREFGLGTVETGIDIKALEKFVETKTRVREKCTHACCPAFNYFYSGSISRCNPAVSQLGAIFERVTGGALSRFLGPAE